MRVGILKAVRYSLETSATYLIYSLLLLSLNLISSVQAASPDADYRDAASVFQKRDLSSCQKAISMLEKILDQKADHLDTQALLAFAYAHEAFILSQFGESGSEYQNSAEAFAKTVLTQQPKNANARKASMLVQLISGNFIDVKKVLESEVGEQETDADLWYMLAIVTDGEKAVRSLSRALLLNADHIWIYSDMAFRALKMNDLVVAEKWLNALEAKRPGVADADLLRAVMAAQRKDSKAMQTAWAELARKAPDFALVARVNKRKKK